MEETKELTVVLTYSVASGEASLDFSNTGLNDLEQIGMVQILKEALNEKYSAI